MHVKAPDVRAFMRLVEKYDLRQPENLAEFISALGLRVPNRRTPTGRSKLPIYGRWSGMMARCYNPNVAIYKHYGGRGIRVCAAWHDFEQFYEDMGDPPPGMSLDRIDVNGHYEPGNVRWATQSEQCINRRPRPNPDYARALAFFDRLENGRG